MKRKYYRFRDPDYVEHLMNITSADDPLFFKPHVWQDMRWLRRQERINCTKGTEPPASDSSS